MTLEFCSVVCQLDKIANDYLDISLYGNQLGR